MDIKRAELDAIAERLRVLAKGCNTAPIVQIELERLAGRVARVTVAAAKGGEVEAEPDRSEMAVAEVHLIAPEKERFYGRPEIMTGDHFLSGLSLCNPNAYIEVPAGTYPYGERGEVEIEAPFLLGRYPVTNGQYQDFIDAKGYRDRTWWSNAGWVWRTKKCVIMPSYWTLYWTNPHLDGPNKPVVGISFYEAEACAAWAGGRLPTEQEWEAAARGPNGSTYPWGNEWRDGLCNTCELELDCTSPVGLFPHSRQAQLGLEDLAGNVWEWCSNCDATDGDFRVVRGGSWFFSQVCARCAYRYRCHPNLRDNDFGFRIVMERK